ncbi:MAG: metallophosphoesterase [Promethearchaeota archaeon]
MKLAVISDIHYPTSITRNTFLYSKCGYKDAFYLDLEQSIKSLDPEEVEGFIVCGDFYWDIRYFLPMPYNGNNPAAGRWITEFLGQIPLDWSFYTNHWDYITTFRSWLHQTIPLFFVEGNHDFWIDCVFSQDNRLYISETAFSNHLMSDFYLNLEQSNSVIKLLDFNNGKVELGENVRILKSNGAFLEDFYLYGFPYVTDDKDEAIYNRFRQHILDLVPNVNSNSSEKLKTIIFHHKHPTKPGYFMDLARNLQIDLKAFFWGHQHVGVQHSIHQISEFGSYVCVMPETNNFKLQLYEF